MKVKNTFLLQLLSLQFSWSISSLCKTSVLTSSNISSSTLEISHFATMSRNAPFFRKKKIQKRNEDSSLFSTQCNQIQCNQMQNNDIKAEKRDTALKYRSWFVFLPSIFLHPAFDLSIKNVFIPTFLFLAYYIQLPCRKWYHWGSIPTWLFKQIEPVDKCRVSPTGVLVPGSCSPLSWHISCISVNTDKAPS